MVNLCLMGACLAYFSGTIKSRENFTYCIPMPLCLGTAPGYGGFVKEAVWGRLRFQLGRPPSLHDSDMK